MKLQISMDDRGNTSLKADGVELNGITTEFSLSQKAGEVPVLNLRIYPLAELDIELPDAVVIVQPEE
nr:MAG: hypothetical protein [Bacteriophage sp.]